MHHALEIQEILRNIFLYFRPPCARTKEAADLASLARTCRTFKEPALDALWEELNDLSTLARCLPEASQSSEDECYSFRRPLTQLERDILRSYTRRIRSVSVDDVSGLDKKSLEGLSKPPTMESLLPNLRHLRFGYTPEARSFLLLPLPSLSSLEVELFTRHSFEDCLKSFAFSKTSPGLKRLYIHPYRYAGVDTSTMDLSFVTQWHNLEVIDCPEIFSDANLLVHLSRLPALTRLMIMLRSTLPDQISPSDTPLIFSNMHQLGLNSGYLDTVSCLLSQTRPPAVAEFSTSIGRRPSRQDLSSFLANVQRSGIGHTIQKLSLDQSYNPRRNYLPRDSPVLGFQDMQPYMAFISLRCIHLSIEWKVDFADNELLTLASAWPCLERFTINEEMGWSTLGGITPNGLLQFLQTCRLLSRVSLVIDTRGYTEIPPSPASLGLTLPHVSSIDVLDSFIEEESVPAITAFFVGVVPRCSSSLRAWQGQGMNVSQNKYVHRFRWKKLFRRVKDIIDQRP